MRSKLLDQNLVTRAITTVMTMVICVAFGNAQIKVGDNVSMNMSGTLTSGYDSSFGYVGSSSHSLTLGGNTYINGSYYNPNFLSFNLEPFYNRSQANSSYQSISNSSGIGGGINLFNGSITPVSLSYSRGYDSTGQYGIPGLSGLTTHGNNSLLGVGWSYRPEGLPPLIVNYQDSTSDSSVYGDTGTATSNVKTLQIQSNYRLAGFNLNASYGHMASSSRMPDFILEGTGVQTSTASSNNYNVNATHSFPLSGGYGLQYTHSSYGNEYNHGAGEADGSSNSFSGNWSIHPFQRLSVTAGGNYNDNLSGSLEQAIINATGQPTFLTSGVNRAIRLDSSVYYQLLTNLSLSGTITHQQQFFLGRDYSVTRYGGNAAFNYSRPLFGSLSFNGGIYDSATQDGNAGMSMYGNVNFSRKIRGWQLSGSYSYAQNVQTLVVIATSSSMSYNASLTKKFGRRAYLNSGFAGGHSGLTALAGTSNHLETYFTTFSYRGYSLSGSLQNSNGTSIYTATGIGNLQNPLPGTLLPTNSLVVYNGKSYSFGVTANPVRRLTMTGSYSRSIGGTTTELANYATGNSSANVLVRYSLRKLFIDAGYTRFWQSLVQKTDPQNMVTSYYIGISRWFNFF